MQTIDLTQHECILNELEKRYYEVQGYNNILDYMINKNMNINSNPNFQNLWKEYLKAFQEYEEYKKYFVENIIIPNSNQYIRWFVDFKKKIVEIYDK